MRAFQGRHGPVSADYARSAVECTAAALGFIPPASVRTFGAGEIAEPGRRDVAMAALICLPTVEACAEALGIEAGRDRWLRVLREAGVVGDTWRPGRGTLCVANDGHACRSLGERSIDDWLSAHGIAHDCEPGWPEHSELNPAELKRADWLLPGNVFVEYAGMLDDAKYGAKLEQKTRLAQAEGIRLVVVTPDDLPRLAAIFSEWSG